MINLTRKKFFTKILPTLSDGTYNSKRPKNRFCMKLLKIQAFIYDNKIIIELTFVNSTQKNQFLSKLPPALSEWTQESKSLKNRFFRKPYISISSITFH